MFDNISLKMRSNLVGAFILIAYGVLLGEVFKSKFVVLISDVISGLAVIGIAALMYPIFSSKLKRTMSITYLILKYIEGSLMVLSGFIILLPNGETFRNILYKYFHLYIFIISAFIFYDLLLKGKIVPKFISIWGMAGIIALTISTFFKLLKINFQIIDYFLVLIITNEIFLAIWLFTKGLKFSEE